MSSQTETSDRTALFLYLLALGSGSFNTTGLILGNGPEAPITAGAVSWLLTGILTTITAAPLWGPNLLPHLAHILKTTALPWKNAGWVPLVASTDMLFYLWATRYIDPGPAMVIWEMHVPLAIATGYVLDPRQEIWTRDLPGLILAIPIATAGLIAVGAAQTGGIPELFSLQGEGLASTAAGAALALGGALAVATSAFAAKAGRNTARQLRNSPATQGMSPARVAVTAIYTGHGIARTAAGSVLLAAGLLSGEPARLLRPVHIGYAGLSTYFGSTTWRTGMAISSRMELHAIMMLLPVLTVAVQLATGVSRTQRPEYLVLGSLLLIAANVLLTLLSMARPKLQLQAPH